MKLLTRYAGHMTSQHGSSAQHFSNPTAPLLQVQVRYTIRQEICLSH